MSFELVYTSARRGLRQGASGFCTVAATEGISRALRDKLESLSGYRNTEVAAGTEPPVNYSHLTIRLQRNIFHVLSRVGDAGIDYTGRTNKIAHHLALTSVEAERFPGGPASMFADYGFWYADWDSEPRTFQPNRFPESFPEPFDGFHTWENVFGDAGWAGILGQAIASGFKSVSVIVPDTKDTMSLLHEALQLVRPEDRWKVCFSTYYSRQVSGTQCHWRFVLEGTSEARRLRARTMGLLVDPTGSAGELPVDNSFVKAARLGRPEIARDTPAASRQRVPLRTTRPADGDETEDGAERPSVKRRREARQTLKPQVERRSPFDIPEEDYAHVAVHKSADEVPESAKGRSRCGNSKFSQRKGLLLVAMLSLAVIAILAFLGFQQLS